MQVFTDPAGSREATGQSAREVRIEVAAIGEPTTGCIVYLDDRPDGSLLISVQRGDATLERIKVGARGGVVMDVVDVQPTSAT